MSAVVREEWKINSKGCVFWLEIDIAVARVISFLTWLSFGERGAQVWREKKIYLSEKWNRNDRRKGCRLTLCKVRG